LDRHFKRITRSVRRTQMNADRRSAAGGRNQNGMDEGRGSLD